MIRPLSLATAALCLALGASAPASAQSMSCVQGDLVGTMLTEEATRIGSNVERLQQADEVSRYIKVINQEPPDAGPAEQLLILVHPRLKIARVFLVNKGIVCERYLIGPDLHQKAWIAARGMQT